METVKIKSSSFICYMRQIVNRYKKQGQCRTGETYDTALNSFLRFRAGEDLPISRMDSGLMEEYEAFLRRAHLTPNTISFYMKHLRAVYNRAVEEGLTMDRKPFKRVYTSVECTAKRALPLDVIRMLRTLDCSCPSRKFARDMFMFSFYTRGMSFVDIAYLKKTDLRGNVLVYRRKKTGQQLSIRLEPCILEILSAYGAEPSSPYLLSIIRNPEGDTRKQYQNAMFLVNRHLKSIGKKLLPCHADGLIASTTRYYPLFDNNNAGRTKYGPVQEVSAVSEHVAVGCFRDARRSENGENYKGYKVLVTPHQPNKTITTRLTLDSSVTTITVTQNTKSEIIDLNNLTEYNFTEYNDKGVKLTYSNNELTLNIPAGEALLIEF